MIVELQKKADIAYELECIVEYIRGHYDIEAIALLQRCFPKLSDLCKEYLDVDISAGKALWEKAKVLTGIEGDLTAVGDQIEIEILPQVKEYIRRMYQISFDVNERFLLRQSEVGYLTIFEKQEKKWLHSRNDPMFEAAQYVRSLYDPAMKTYYVYGCGMGYHLYQIWEQSEGFSKIVLWESDDLIYEIAKEFGVLSRIPEEAVLRKTFSSAEAFLEEADENQSGILFHLPSVSLISHEEQKRKLITRWMRQNTVRSEIGKHRKNRIRNEMLQLPEAEILVNKERCTEAVIAAAGPSLAEHLEEFCGRENKKLIAVGHAVKKLLAENILPDLVVLIDHDFAVLEHVTDILGSEIPILIDPNVHWKVAESHQGPVYMMRDWNYGGTVASAAIETALKMGAKKITLTGLDLGYPGMKRYADGLSGGREMKKEEDLFEVESTDGGMVWTDKHMDYYRRQIEQQIAMHGDVTFYNLSEHGARIRGTLSR